jgi:glutamyl-tRNA reductase
MNIIVIGLNYKQTPIEIREKLNFKVTEQKKALDEIIKIEGINECILLSTCNRTEIYIYSEYSHFDSSKIEKKVCELKGLDLYNIKKHFYIYSCSNAVRHIFKVASGLESMVLGEDQILRQVKDAYDFSLKACTSSSVLNTLFRDAITVAKRVKTFTEISKNSVSIGTQAVLLIEKLLVENLKNKSALIIGAGKIGSITLKNLLSKGIGNIFVTNRIHGKVQNISELYDNVEIIDYAMRYSVMDKCDVIISSTTSPHYTVTKDLLENAIKVPKQRVFIDLAVPRDIDVDIKQVSGVLYFNIDHLKVEVDKNLDKRLLEASKAEEIVSEYVLEYENWYHFREVLPIVKDAQKFANEILNEKINFVMNRLKCSSDEDKEVIKLSIKNAVNEILNKFIFSVKETGNKEDIKTYFRCISEIIKEN